MTLTQVVGVGELLSDLLKRKSQNFAVQKKGVFYSIDIRHEKTLGQGSLRGLHHLPSDKQAVKLLRAISSKDVRKGQQRARAGPT